MRVANKELKELMLDIAETYKRVHDLEAENIQLKQELKDAQNLIDGMRKHLRHQNYTTQS